MTPTRIRVYQNRRLQRIDLNIDDVPFPAARFDEVLSELFPQVGNVDVHDVGEAVVLLVVDVVVDPGARDQFLPVQRQQLEERVLLDRQLHELAPLLDGSGGRVDLNVSQPEDGGRLVRRAADEGA